MLAGLMGGFRARMQPDGRLLLLVGKGADTRVISLAGGARMQFSIEPLSGGWRLLMSEGGEPAEIARFDDASAARRALRRIACAMAGSAGPWAILRWTVVMLALGLILMVEFNQIPVNINAAQDGPALPSPSELSMQPGPTLPSGPAPTAPPPTAPMPNTGPVNPFNGVIPGGPGGLVTPPPARAAQPTPQQGGTPQAQPTAPAPARTGGDGFGLQQ